MSLLSKVLGDPHRREIGRHLRVVEEVNGLEDEMRALSDDELRHKTDVLRERIGYDGPDISFGQTYAEDLDVLGESASRASAEFASGDVGAESEGEIDRQIARRERAEREEEEAEHLDEILPEAFAVAREAAAARPGHAPLRRPAHRRHRPPRGQDRRDEDRRGQDPRRDARRSTSTRWPARAPTSSPSTTTWPGATPSGWAPLPLPRAVGGGHRAGPLLRLRPRLPRRAAPRRAAAAPAPCTRREAYAATSPTAPTTSSASTTCATTWPWTSTRWSSAAALRHRRRGRLDPHRRGADAADHQRPGAARRPRSTSPFARLIPRLGRRGRTSPSTRRRKSVPSPRRASPRSRSAPGSRTSTTSSTSLEAHQINQALKAHAPLQARPRLHRQGRRGRHRRRVHRPPMPGRRWSRRAAPGDRGQGGACRSSRRTRPSPRSPSRTTSASTRSSPA